MSPDLAPAVEALRRAIHEVPTDGLPNLLGVLEDLKARAWVRLVSPPANGAGKEAPRPATRECLISPDEAAALAGMPRRWVLRRTKGLRFRRHLSRKVIRFEEAGFRRWIAATGRVK